MKTLKGRFEMPGLLCIDNTKNINVVFIAKRQAANLNFCHMLVECTCFKIILFLYKNTYFSHLTNFRQIQGKKVPGICI